MLVAGVVFGGASAIKYHYMVVVLLPAPIWLFLRWRDLDPPDWPGRAFALALVAVTAVFVVVGVRGGEKARQNSGTRPAAARKSAEN